MKRMVWWVMAIIVGVSVSLFIWLYFSAGLKEYLGAVMTIKRLPSEESSVAWDNFLTIGEPNLYGGILAGFWNNKVWVWGRSGLRAFRVDNDSVYSFFSACAPEILAKTEKGEAVSVGRSIYTVADEWLIWVKRGNYVTVAQATEGSGGVEGNLREVYGYDWRVFMPGDLQKQCAN